MVHDFMKNCIGMHIQNPAFFCLPLMRMVYSGGRLVGVWACPSGGMEVILDV